MRCRTEIRKKEVDDFKELMARMDKVMKENKKFLDRIDIANILLGNLIEPFIKNLLDLPVTEINRTAWVLWPFQSAYDELFDNESRKIRHNKTNKTESSNEEKVFSSQVFSIVSEHQR